MCSLSLENLDASILPKVEFINFEEQYSYEEDLVCHFRLVDYQIQEGDRIAIFKLGWQFLKEYVLFEWVSPESDTVIFKEENLPKDISEIYQLCFITGTNAILGVSKPIQFCKKGVNMFQSQSTFRDSLVSTCSSRNLSSPVPKMANSSDDRVITELKKENEMLKETLKVVIASNKLGKIENEVSDVKVIMKYLQETVINQQKEIENLKKIFTDHINVCQNLQSNIGSESKENNVALDFELDELPSIPPPPMSFLK